MEEEKLWKLLLLCALQIQREAKPRGSCRLLPFTLEAAPFQRQGVCMYLPCKLPGAKGSVRMKDLWIIHMSALLCRVALIFASGDCSFVS